jgi:hypothetical protein
MLILCGCSPTLRAHLCASRSIALTPRTVLRKAVAATVALAVSLVGQPAFAQHLVPGGPIGNSLGFGSGLGGVIGGTGPSYSNGTTQPTLPAPPPPGGDHARVSPLPAIVTALPHSYPKPLDSLSPPLGSGSLSLKLPEAPSNDLSFLRGCWRTDVFRLSSESGVTIYCFDDQGSGRFLYRRLDQPEFFCNGSTSASYAGADLRLHNSNTRCTDGSVYPDMIACQRGAGDWAQCSGKTTHGLRTETWTIRLHRTRTAPWTESLR